MFVLKQMGRLAFTSTCVVDQLMAASRSETEAARKLAASSSWAIRRRTLRWLTLDRGRIDQEKGREISRPSVSVCLRGKVTTGLQTCSRWTFID